jgi:dihydrofolate reductase
MKISMILAMDENRGIGVENKLPWHLSADLKRFSALTRGHHIIMGRKTHESIGKTLPCRRNVILTRNSDYLADGCIVVHTPQAALSLVSEYCEDEVFIIGGAEIYTEFLPEADRLYITIVHTQVEADTFFPVINEDEWIETTSKYYPADDSNNFPNSFKILDRITDSSAD